jgi:hypothetical protein
MAAKTSASKYLSIFPEFIKDLRISSKEETSDDDRGTKLVLWESQKRAISFIGQGLDDDIHNFYILKSRQLGITTGTLAIDVLWAAMNPGLNGCIVTENEKNRDRNRQIIKQYVNSFPEGYFGESFSITTNNRQVIRFSNKSQFELLVAGVKRKASSSWAEGSGYTYAHLTEVAAYGDIAGLESLEESFAQKNPNRVFIYESTAKGQNHWQSRYLEGQTDPFTKRSTFIGWWAGDTNRIERGEARFAAYGSHGPTPSEREKIHAVKVLYDWDITPEQLAWIRWKESNPSADLEMLQQNQPWTAEEAFVQTGYSFFQIRSIGKDIQTITQATDAGEDTFAYIAYRYILPNNFFEMTLEPLTEEDDVDDIELRVWEPPVNEGKYVIGFDPAWGRTDHGDRSVISVFRCYADKMVQVAEFATANVELIQCTWVLAHLAGAYKDCVVNIELNGPGRVVMAHWNLLLAQMREKGSTAEGAQTWEDALGTARWYLYHKPDTMGAGYAYNTDSSSRVKQELLHNFRGHYVTQDLVIRSIPLLNEMKLVVQNGNVIGAPESANGDCKDDRVFAAAYAVAAWLDWRRVPMIANGETYERMMAIKENGEQTMAERINRITYGFIHRQVEAAGQVDNRPQWMVARGLV